MPVLAKNTIFDIQRFSIHDGRGIRTTIFFKGCPLRCMWCSNPESQTFSKDIFFDARRCKGFGDCMNTGDGAFTIRDDRLVINRQVIEDPILYSDVCPSRALRVTGEYKSIDDLLEEIHKDLDFYRQSEGGITLTGGEPFAQDEWLFDFVRELKNKKIHISVETCLHIPWGKIEPFVSYIDEFLIDLKHINARKFKKFTGGNIHLVLDNLSLIDEFGVDYVLRIPVIPTFNHSMIEMKNIINFAGTLKNCKKLDFIPYHSLGEIKYEMLGKSYPFKGIKSVPEKELEPYMKYALQKGFNINTGV